MVVQPQGSTAPSLPAQTRAVAASPGAHVEGGGIAVVGEGEGPARLEPADSEEDGVRALGAVKDVQQEAAGGGWRGLVQVPASRFTSG